MYPNNNSKRTYLFFDTVHLVKTIRSNLLHSKKFVLLSFNFSDCNTETDLLLGERYT